MAWDFMGELRSWLRSDATLNPLHAGRVFFRIPTDLTNFPAIRMYRLGGSLLPGEVDGLRTVRLGLDVFGGEPRQGQAGTFAQVDALTNAIEELVHTTEQTAIGTHTFYGSGEIAGCVFTPDPQTGAPGYAITAALLLQQQ